MDNPAGIAEHSSRIVEPDLRVLYPDTDPMLLTPEAGYMHGQSSGNSRTFFKDCGTGPDPRVHYLDPDPMLLTPEAGYMHRQSRRNSGTILKDCGTGPRGFSSGSDFYVIDP